MAIPPIREQAPPIPRAEKNWSVTVREELVSGEGGGSEGRTEGESSADC